MSCGLVVFMWFHDKLFFLDNGSCHLFLCCVGFWLMFMSCGFMAVMLVWRFHGMCFFAGLMFGA